MGEIPNKSTLGIAEDALKKWKLASLESKARNPADGAKPTIAPLRGMKAKTFLETVDALEVCVGEVDSLQPPKNVCRKVAITLALRGFLDWRHLEGVEPGECQNWCSTSSQNALLERCVIAANNAARRQARKRNAVEIETVQLGRTVGPKVPCSMPREQIGTASSRELADSMNQASLEEREVALQEKLVESDLEGLGERLTPSKAVAALGKSQAAGNNVSETLAEMVDLLFLETNRKTLSTVASGLRCWDQFALMKGYPADSTLPPRHDGDVLQYITIFKNGDTTANYVSYIGWACKKLRLSLEW